ncbi:MAG: CHAT domain-containing protein [Bacteroidetes Order II. Incertae sedis bacterium]|nr:CHAT domain-containing protein [Bacteroidetes Order II. bacterium]
MIKHNLFGEFFFVLLFCALPQFIHAAGKESCAALELRWKPFYNVHFELWDNTRLETIFTTSRNLYFCKTSKAEQFKVLITGIRAAQMGGKGYGEVSHLLNLAKKTLPYLSGNEEAIWFRLNGNLAWRRSKFEAAWNYAQAFSRFDSLTSPYEQAAIALSMALVLENSNNPKDARKFLTLTQELLNHYKGNPSEIVSLKSRLHSVMVDNYILEKVDLSEGSMEENVELRKLIQPLKEDIILLEKNNKYDQLINVYIGIGQLYSYLKEFNLSYSSYEQARQIAIRVQKTERLAFIYYRMGQLSQQQNQIRQAILFFEKALHLATSTNSRYLISRIQNRYGFSLEQAGRIVEAEAVYRQYILDAENARADMGITDFGKTNFLSNENASFLGLVRILIQTKRFEEALYWLDATRGRFLENLNEYANWVAGLPQSQQRELSTIESRIAFLRASATKNDKQQGNHNHISELKTYVEQILLQSKANRLWKSSHSLTQMKRDQYSSDFLKQLQARLREQHQVALFYYLDRETDPTILRAIQSYVVVVTPESVHFVPLRVHGQEVGNLLNSLYRTRERSIHFDLRTLYQLYQGLFAPVENVINGYQRVVLFKDDVLVRLPFSMLVAQPPKNRFDYGHADFLVRRFSFSQELSVTLYTGQSQRRNAPTSFSHNLIFGRSQFGSAEFLAPLPGVYPEVKTIGSLLPWVKIGLDGGAKEFNFKRDMAKSYLMHLASHTIMNAENPLYTFLSLRKSGNNDGKLFLFELFYNRLHTELVTLSSCNSGVGERLSGEGFAGMQYALRSAGVKSVLATNWPAADNAFPNLMQKFYRGLKSGLPKDQALRNAQLHLLHSGSRIEKSPYYWASLLLYGDSSPLSFKPVFAALSRQHVAAFLLLILLLLFYQWQFQHQNKRFA